MKECAIDATKGQVECTHVSNSGSLCKNSRFQSVGKTSSTMKRAAGPLSITCGCIWSPADERLLLSIYTRLWSAGWIHTPNQFVFFFFFRRIFISGSLSPHRSIDRSLRLQHLTTQSICWPTRKLWARPFLRCDWEICSVKKWRHSRCCYYPTHNNNPEEDLRTLFTCIAPARHVYNRPLILYEGIERERRRESQSVVKRRRKTTPIHLNRFYPSSSLISSSFDLERPPLPLYWEMHARWGRGNTHTRKEKGMT